jgi:hypothetical protein
MVYMIVAFVLRFVPPNTDRLSSRRAEAGATPP